jgi:hypothetical protein
MHRVQRIDNEEHVCKRKTGLKRSMTEAVQECRLAAASETGFR